VVRAAVDLLSEQQIKAALRDLPLGGIRYYETTPSTNDAALEWAAAGGADLSLVFAEQQTAGRGRSGRKWVTNPGTTLTFSLVIKPMIGEIASVSLFSGLGALAVSEALWAEGWPAEIKWPNDVLLNQRKMCGVLAEAVWLGDKLTHIVLGAGVNVLEGSIPQGEALNFPATSIESEISAPVNRLALLREIMLAFLYWRGLLSSELFLRTWEKRLAFRDEQVEIQTDGKRSMVGKVEGLEREGSLRLRLPDGKVEIVQFGEVHLRPVM
jgi:BirA family transcriptional regulator, biotin operon repressor / biotin---[acetyl-CoA-carboxylase] ligase